ncbi:MAG TPA: pitrilysin family protein [Alphaproteobacteria bacterium]|nr:pitrilysin family protein [Alphaproteobacteria bacterium]
MVKHPPSKNKLLSLIWGFILSFIFILPVEAKVFNAESFKLENGLEIIVIPKKTAPVVTSMIWYKVGAADEPQGKSGMAHYFEHLMFKGTSTLAPGDFSKTIRKLGGNDNAFTGQDYTAYFETISTDKLAQVLRMEADRMVNLSPPPEHFASEKNVVLEERRQRTENDPKGLFSEQMLSALYTNHPYGTPVIGWMDEIKEYQWEDVKKFYDIWYAPNNAILILSGNITAKDVQPIVQEAFGNIPKKEIPPRSRTTIPPSIGSTTMVLNHETINQPTFQNVRIVPSYAENKSDSLALQVLQEILSGGPTTRLYKHLVVDQKKAISVGFSYDSSALNDSTLWISGTPAEGVSLEELENLVENEIKNIITNGVSDLEVKEAIQRLQDAAVFVRDSVSGPAMIFGQELTTGSTVEDVENWPENINLVTPQQIQNIAQKYLDSENPWRRTSITGHLLPLSKSSAERKEDLK